MPMPRQILFLCLIFALPTMALAEWGPPSGPEQDAELTSVFFLNEKIGWAVGDRGVIWHTQDGGNRWQPQASHVTERLEKVIFLDAKVGWICGGSYDPYTHLPRGLLLYTDDGGKHWSRRTRDALPCLKGIGFFNDREGWAYGEPNRIYPSGLLTTVNGGRSWRSVSGANARGWSAAHFSDLTSAAVADKGGNLAIVQRHQVREGRSFPLGLRSGREIHLHEDGIHGWCVGDGGLVLWTQDGGSSWQAPSGELPQNGTALFDWHAVAADGQNVWIAGSPGTKLLHSPDGGKSWTWQSTGVTVPLLDLHFVSDREGWAVGMLGNILHTTDGGTTWKTQRSGGKRAALWACYAKPQDVPLEVIAKCGGNQGYLSIVHSIARYDLLPGQESASQMPERCHEAMLQLGGTRGQIDWRFPIPSDQMQWTSDNLMRVWNQVHDGEGLGKLEFQLVQQIRQWQPEVVLTHAASPTGTNPLAHLMNQLVLRAVERAADSTWYSEQIVDGGLKTWKVKKVFGSHPAEQLGDINVETSQIAMQVGQSLAEWASQAQGELIEEPRPRPNLWGFHQCLSRLPQSSGGNDFFTGIDLKPGGEARRRLNPAAPLATDQLRRQAERRRNLAAIMERAEEHPQGSPILLGQMGDLVRDFPEKTAGELIYQMALQFHHSGNGDWAAQMMELLISQYPKHPAAERAAIWLVHYWSSGEMEWRSQQKPNAMAASGVVQTGLFLGGGQAGLRGNQSPIGGIDETTMINRPEKAIQYSRWLQTERPMLYQEPSIRFPAAVAERRAGYGRQAERYYLTWLHQPSEEAWKACALGESWLAEPNEFPPKSIWNVKRTRSKPKLDGELNDPCWLSAKQVFLKSPQHDDGRWPASVRLAYDEEYLYVSAECQKFPGRNYSESTDSPRDRDADVSQQDRLLFMIDLDRDWTTCYRFQIDSRGRVAEDCWQDTTWNPNWYVAHQQTDQTWKVEIAIPLRELTGKTVDSHTVWAAGVMRQVPKEGFQSWTHPAEPEGYSPGFGYLLFQ
ncbi:Hypothetical protein PBC10988_41530 [Planctomycetales bacterium 10988]|nr:Hypothetical protein PBC10988_41530 [Planctomycetales bacterium 10988]